MRRIQLAHHQIQQTPHLVRRLRAGDQRLILSADLVPVLAVKSRIVKVVAKVGPSLPKHFHLLARKIDVHLGRYRERTRASLEIDCADAAVVEIEDLLAVGRELRGGLRRRRRGQLLGDDRIARQLVE